jgi:hypothetical protein
MAGPSGGRPYCLLSDKYRSRSIQAFRAIAEFGINSKDLLMDYVFGMF